MILARLVAFPESRRILIYHLLATALTMPQYGLMALVPVLIRTYFRGGEWPTTLAATAIVMMSLLSIFWHEVYRRMSYGRYALLLWLMAYVPLGGIALAHSAWVVLACVFVSAIGTAGVNPLTGDILRSCYPPAARSKVWGALQSVTQLAVMVTAWGVGMWLDVNVEAFRIYFPIGAAVMGTGVWLLSRIGRQQLFLERPREKCEESLWASMAHSYRSMFRSLAHDSSFRQFEASYCTFNFAWLTCVGLIPLLVADVLKLPYRQVALCSEVPLRLALVLGAVPAGFIMDRLGPVRMSIWGLALVILHPTGLVLATHGWHVAVATLILGISFTAINLAWTIGPVTLAKDPAESPHYLAIHWTMTTLVGLAGQVPAVAYYRATGDIYTPLKIAAGTYVVAVLLMYRLHRVRRRQEQELVAASARVEERMGSTRRREMVGAR